jgi:hypothetical protein
MHDMFRTISFIYLNKPAYGFKKNLIDKSKNCSKLKTFYL